MGTLKIPFQCSCLFGVCCLSMKVLSNRMDECVRVYLKVLITRQMSMVWETAELNLKTNQFTHGNAVQPTSDWRGGGWFYNVVNVELWSVQTCIASRCGSTSSYRDMYARANQLEEVETARESSLVIVHFSLRNISSSPSRWWRDVII